MRTDDRSDRQVVSYVDRAVKIALEKAAALDQRPLSNYVAKVLTDHVNQVNKGS